MRSTSINFTLTQCLKWSQRGFAKPGERTNQWGIYFKRKESLYEGKNYYTNGYSFEIVIYAYDIKF